MTYRIITLHNIMDIVKCHTQVTGIITLHNILDIVKCHTRVTVIITLHIIMDEVDITRRWHVDLSHNLLIITSDTLHFAFDQHTIIRTVATMCYFC